VTKEKPRNLAASVRQRLSDLARKLGEDFQLVLTRYAIERFLYRLSRSEHRNDFVLKGAMLFRLWADQPHRPTRDLDLLGKGDSSIERMVEVFRGVCGLDVEEDGLTFDPDSVEAGLIKEDQDYEGVRVNCTVRLGQARIILQVDVGFGDAVTPRAVDVQYPTILAFPAPVLPAYPRETVVAEKFQAMVALGIANSRMKDFFDLWCLARDFAFDGQKLAEAIGATFRRRETELPDDMPIALSEEFALDATKQTQWNAFLKKANVGERIDLDEVLALLREFLLPPTGAIAGKKAFKLRWTARGPWRPQG